METTGADVAGEEKVGASEGEETVRVHCGTKVDELVTTGGSASSSESNAVMSTAALFCDGLRVSLGQGMGGMEVSLSVEIEVLTVLLG